MKGFVIWHEDQTEMDYTQMLSQTGAWTLLIHASWEAALVELKHLMEVLFRVTDSREQIDRATEEGYLIKEINWEYKL